MAPNPKERPAGERQELQQAKATSEKACPECGSTGKRNLIVCIDGTSNQFSTKNTNVVELYSRLVKDETQLTFYNSGIGTYAKPSWRSWSYRKQVIANQLDLAFALHFEKIIISAYVWLVDNYLPGDRIFLFGFSRGACQVRALAAMIDIVGLLRKGNNDQLAFAYELYAATGIKHAPEEACPLIYEPEKSSMGEKIVQAIRSLMSRIPLRLPRKSEENLQSFPRPLYPPGSRAEPMPSSTTAMQKQFKSTFSRTVRVHFVGAWDTLSSVGFIRDKTLPATTDGMKSVCYFRHALALHEYRVKFLPEYANGGNGPNSEEPRPGMPEPHTKEVWFTGSHSDM
ncbi:hypothetical protein AURDEDRAFT_73151 [Auricularia subglabra TFB-10046 SS5]|nr:hypothetical protein AURDEDRAFT_73151 [Auricularia subglabra TFB-10046 SS5]